MSAELVINCSTAERRLSRERLRTRGLRPLRPDPGSPEEAGRPGPSESDARSPAGRATDTENPSPPHGHREPVLPGESKVHTIASFSGYVSTFPKSHDFDTCVRASRSSAGLASPPASQRPDGRHSRGRAAGCLWAPTSAAARGGDPGPTEARRQVTVAVMRHGGRRRPACRRAHRLRRMEEKLDRIANPVQLVAPPAHHRTLRLCAARTGSVRLSSYIADEDSLKHP